MPQNQSAKSGMETAQQKRREVNRIPGKYVWVCFLFAPLFFILNIYCKSHEFKTPLTSRKSFVCVCFFSVRFSAAWKEPQSKTDVEESDRKKQQKEKRPVYLIFRFGFVLC